MNKVKEWETMKKSGLTYQQIAEKYGITRQSVWEALSKIGYEKKKENRHEIWKALVKCDVPVKKIAEKYGVSVQSVYAALKK